MAGEEVVGGIIGYLRLDADQFHREIVQALNEVKALKGQNVNVDVKTNAKAVERELDGAGRAAKGVSREVGGMSRSFRGLHDPRVIVGALAAGITLLGPLAGAATAAIGGLIGVVGTGVLAFRGLKKEIEEGTALGVGLQSSLDSVGAEFNDLSTIAAHAMSGGVLDSLSTLRRELPGLSGDVEILGGHLGNALSMSTKGLMSGLRTMMPLLLDGGRYAEIFAQNFAEFAESREFKEFVDYSRRMLPEVADALGEVSKGVVVLAESLSGEGEGIVEVVGVIGKAMQALGVVADIDGLMKGKKGAFEDLARPLAEWKYGTLEAAAATDIGASSLAGMGAATSAVAVSLGATNAALSAAKDAQHAHKEAAAQATVQMQVENDAAGILKQTFDALTGEQLSLANAQNAFDSSLVTMGTHVNKTGKQITFTTSSITNMSAASVALRGQLNGQVANLQRVVEANGGLENSTDSAKAKYAAMAEQIVQNAKKHGINEAAVRKYLSGLIDVNDFKPKPTQFDVDTKAALGSIAAFQAKIDGVHGKTVRLTTVEYTTKAGSRSTKSGAFAKGGVIGYAKGGIPGFAGGTLIGPGTGTSDSIMAMVSRTNEMVRLSNGEFISTDASRRRNRGALEAGNQGAQLAVAGRGGGNDVPAGDVHAHVYIDGREVAEVVIDRFGQVISGGRTMVGAG